MLTAVLKDTPTANTVQVMCLRHRAEHAVHYKHKAVLHAVLQSAATTNAVDTLANGPANNDVAQSGARLENESRVRFTWSSHL